MKNTILMTGLPSVGKTAILQWLIPYLRNAHQKIQYCKIDPYNTHDEKYISKLHIPCITGISNDICPDHFLVSNLVELYKWANQSDYLIIETAGLCTRCSPATNQMIACCVFDATSSTQTSKIQGPLLTKADYILLSKVDLISQAEKEIIVQYLQECNPSAKIFQIDGLNGYGCENFARTVLKHTSATLDTQEYLRHSMPKAVCSYCVGEIRIGNAFQQGIVEKIEFGDK